LSLQAQSSVARARERRRSRAHPGQTQCAVADCRADVDRVVEIELPAAWEASPTYSVLTVCAGACREHAPELERRAQALLAARADIHNLLVILEDAVTADLGARTASGAGSAGSEDSGGSEAR
jgi:hypothetical protein